MARNRSTVGVFLGATNVGRPSHTVRRTLRRIARIPYHGIKFISRISRPKTSPLRKAKRKKKTKR